MIVKVDLREELIKISERVELEITAKETFGDKGDNLLVPKSILEKKETAKETFDDKGGNLQLPKSNIALYIPRGALSATKEIEISSLVSSNEFVLSGDRITFLEGIEVLPHQTFFREKLTIFQPLKHLRHKCCNFSLRLFYNSGLEESFTLMGVLHSSQRKLIFKGIVVKLTDEGISISAMRFCQILTLGTCKLSKSYLSLYHKQTNATRFSIRAALCCGCEILREKIISEQLREGYTFKSSWSFLWNPTSSSKSSLEISFSKENERTTSQYNELNERPITFSKDDLMSFIGSESMCTLTYDRRFEDKRSETSRKDLLIITAECIYTDIRETRWMQQGFSILGLLKLIVKGIMRFLFFTENDPISTSKRNDLDLAIDVNQPSQLARLDVPLLRQPTDDELTELSKRIVGNWSIVAKRLNIDDSSIRELDITYSEVRRKAYHMLKTWIEKNDSFATVRALCDALRKEGLNSTVCDIFEH